MYSLFSSLPQLQPMTGDRRRVLPPIGGRVSGSAAVGNEKKKPVTGDEAGMTVKIFFF